MNKYIWNIKKQIKKTLHKKINIVFICHRPNVWGSLKTVFEACNNDKSFNVTIIAIPNKKELPNLGLNHEIYETEGAEDFFKDYPCKVVNGYNYETQKWFELKSLKPDYVFIQQPYNICKPSKYHSKKISKYCKLCYVHYGILIFKGEVQESVYPPDFFKNVDFVFSENKEQQFVIENLAKKINSKLICKLTGYPRFDGLDKYRNINSDNWNLPMSENVKRIIWTPRWCTNENNCHFFEYKDKLIEYAEENKDIDFIFRPHPQAFLNWNATGELSKKEAEKHKKRYKNCNNAKIDTRKEYLTTFYSSDFMITDISSIIPEYFLTGKPIIYCHRTNHFNKFGEKMAEGFYWVHNWEELEKTIEMLKRGEDPLYEKRQQIIKDNFYINPNGAGNTIKEIIKKDFYGKN